MFSQNDKMRKTGKMGGVKILNFGLPAIKTCPFAGKCKKGCYATQGWYNSQKVKDAQQRRFEASKKASFCDLISYLLEKQRPDYVRLHDSGDFYSMKYVQKWFEIIRNFPGVSFYAYTKSVPYFRWIKIPKNFTPVFSFGGRRDNWIDKKKDRHAIVVRHQDDIPQGYVDASENDLLVFKHKKIAVLYHGNLVKYEKSGFSQL